MNDNNIKSFKTALEKEKWNNVFLSQTAEMAAIWFNQTRFLSSLNTLQLNINKHLHHP